MSLPSVDPQPSSSDSSSHDAPDQPTSTSASTTARVPLIIHPLRHLDLGPAHPTALLHTAAGVESQPQALADTEGPQTASLGATDPAAEILHTILRAALSNLDGLQIQLGDRMTGSDDTDRIQVHHRCGKRRGQNNRRGIPFEPQGCAGGGYVAQSGQGRRCRRVARAYIQSYLAWTFLGCRLCLVCLAPCISTRVSRKPFIPGYSGPKAKQLSRH